MNKNSGDNSKKVVSKFFKEISLKVGKSSLNQYNIQGKTLHSHSLSTVRDTEKLTEHLAKRNFESRDNTKNLHSINSIYRNNSPENFLERMQNQLDTHCSDLETKKNLSQSKNPNKSDITNADNFQKYPKSYTYLNTLTNSKMNQNSVKNSHNHTCKPDSEKRNLFFGTITNKYNQNQGKKFFKTNADMNINKIDSF